MKHLYIHCGLHKTGTTALQHALSTNSGVLLKQGFLYPKIGTYAHSAGQHNLAFQLNRDRRFTHTDGDWAKLFAQIQTFNGNTLISSEGFETGLISTKRLQPVLDQAAKLELQVTFIIYLRNPVSYLESLYLELLKHGYGEEFINIFNHVMTSGKLRVRESEHCFSYPKIKEAFSSMQNVKLIFRNYDALVGNSVVEDFKHVLQLDGFTEENNLKHINARNGLNRSLKLFARNRQWSWFSNSDPKFLYKAIDLISKHDQHSHGQYKLVMPQKLKNVFNHRFDESIQFIAALKIKQPSEQAVTLQADQSAISTSKDVMLIDMQRAFSFESYVWITKIAHLISNAEKTNTALNSNHLALTSAWWLWVRISDI